MIVNDFIKILDKDFFVGVPDSLLKPFGNYLINEYGLDPKHHIIASNEGSAVGIAAGYHLATGKVPVVYMQNSGEGNIINPLASLLNEKVYAIPTIFVIGWRGEPGVHDEPQHVFQGEVTLKLLETMNIEYYVIEKTTSLEALNDVMQKFNDSLEQGRDVAFVVKKGAFSYDGKVEYKNDNLMKREEIIQHIIKYSDTDPIISTTGKTSRELYETRELESQGHEYDFLTVGSMGHSSSIALGVALNKPEQKIWCIDGDGAVIMHMGALAIIGTLLPSNLVHIVINNEAHESVGGQPTAATNLNISELAKDSGYSYTACVDNFEDLDKELELAKSRNELTFIEVKSAIGSRDDLGRPKTTPIENKNGFMGYLDKM